MYWKLQKRRLSIRISGVNSIQVTKKNLNFRLFILKFALKHNRVKSGKVCIRNNFRELFYAWKSEAYYDTLYLNNMHRQRGTVEYLIGLQSTSKKFE